MTYYRYSARYGILTLEEFEMIRKTPCGAWIDVYKTQKFVLDYAKKKYANPTKEEALEAYYARKRQQIRILESRLQQAEEELLLTPENPSNFSFDIL